MSAPEPAEYGTIILIERVGYTSPIAGEDAQIVRAAKATAFLSAAHGRNSNVQRIGISARMISRV
jgi:hypothetical protein